MPRQPGRITAEGPHADALAAALRAPHVDHDIAESLTHPFHSYPARLHPATARVLVENAGPGLIVDPFCGSGTVLVEARAAGNPAVGSDLNPLAVLVAFAKTWTAAPGRRQAMQKTGGRIAQAVLLAGKNARRSGAEPMPQRKPHGFDPNGRNRRLASWFQPHTRRELEMLAALIDEVQDAPIRNVLLACLSAILYKVSSRTSDTDGTWVDRNIARGNAARLFATRVELLAAGLADMGKGDPPDVFEIDARRLHEVVADGSAAAVITSPPYAGTYDYAEHQRLRFDFLGLRHAAMDEGEIGSRRSFAKTPDATRMWHSALTDSIAAIARALRPGGTAALVIGDSVALNKGFYALDDIRDALTDELVLESWASQERPMLGAMERRAFGERPKAEHVILLRRRQLS